MAMSMREQVKQLWKLCFQDTDDFVDLYFRMRYTDEINSAIEMDGRVVAALQRVPYSLTCFGTVIPVAYISGACTHPSYRKHGLMRRLLAEAHREMYRQGICMSTLIPAEEGLKQYYARSGYAVCFRQQEKLLTTCSLPVDNSLSALEIRRIDLLKSLPENLVHFACEQGYKQPCSIQHSSEDWQVIAADHRLDGGEVLVGEEGGNIHALAFCKYQEGELTVKELLADTEADERRMLKALFRYYEAGALRRILPAGPDEGYALGMARLIRVEEVLRLYAVRYPDRYWTLEVTGDEAIPENNGFYLLEQGTCRKGRDEHIDYEPYTLAGLTESLFRDERPFMNLMLN